MVWKNKKLIITAVCVSLFVFMALFFDYFLFIEVNGARQKVLETRRRIYEYRNRIENAKELKSALENTEIDYSKISGIFLNRESVVNFIEELEYLAEKTGAELKIKSVNTPSNSKEKPDFSLSLSGSFSSVYHFIFLLENDRYRVALTNILFSKQKEKTNWDADLKIKLLSYDNAI